MSDYIEPAAIIVSTDMSGAAPVDMSGAAPVDLSGATLKQTPAAVPVSAPPPTAVEATPSVAELTPALVAVVEGIVSDLSGVPASAGDLIRFVPRLASLVHALQIRGSEKRDLVMAAAHALVDRVIGDTSRPVAHTLVDAVFPHAIAGVIDVVAGRVTFQQAAESAAAMATSAATSNPAAVVAAGNCLTQMLSACLRKQ
jgi:hypothetical protein